MSAPVVPSPLDYIGCRRFVLHPEIENGGPNEWVMGMRSRAEVQALNALTGLEVWIPRQHIGAVSDHAGLVTVGLRKTLRYEEGELIPRSKHVIEMPPPVHLSSARHGPAPVVAIRLEERPKSPATKAMTGLVVGALLIAIVIHLSSTVYF